MVRCARASGVTRRSRRVGRIGWLEWYGQVIWWAVRKAVLGTRELISLSRSILGADPGQREERTGSGAVAAAAAAESAYQPASPRFAGPACQVSRPALTKERSVR